MDAWDYLSEVQIAHLPFRGRGMATGDTVPNSQDWQNGSEAFACARLVIGLGLLHDL